MRKLFVCLAVALLAAGCNSEDGGGGSPTDPSQVNIEFSTTDLVVGTGAEAAVPAIRATANFELWLYNAAGTASKGTRIQGSSDPNPQVPGTTIGPITLIMGTGQIVGTQIDPWFRARCPRDARGRQAPHLHPVKPRIWLGGRRRRPIPPNAALVFEVELTNIQ